jgi:invasion protein IalB
MRCTLAVVLTLVEAYASAQSAKPPSVKTPPSPTTVAPPVEPSLAAGAGAGQPPPKAGWASRCASADRKSDLDCSVEQSVALKTGQIVVQFTVTVQAGGKSPVAIVVLPLGIFLPAGAKAEVDDQKPVDLTLETCDQRGCYAKASVSPDLLSAMKTGKTMTVSFTTMTKDTVNIPLQLSEFAEAYGKIQ